jgi:chromosome segregation ATPase
MAKFKRHLRKEIEKGKADLPEELLFLADSNYFAISEQRLQGVREWYVEIVATSFKTLLDAKGKLNAARLSNRNLKKEVSRLENSEFFLEKELRDKEDLISKLRAQVEEATVKNDILQVEMRKKEVEIRDITADLNVIKDEIEPLRNANAQLLDNLENGSRHVPEKKNQKNFFTVMEERGVPLSGPAIRGGGGGSTKR